MEYVVLGTLLLPEEWATASSPMGGGPTGKPMQCTQTADGTGNSPSGNTPSSTAARKPAGKRFKFGASSGVTSPAKRFGDTLDVAAVERGHFLNTNRGPAPLSRSAHTCTSASSAVTAEVSWSPHTGEIHACAVSSLLVKETGFAATNVVLLECSVAEFARENPGKDNDDDEIVVVGEVENVLEAELWRHLGRLAVSNPPLTQPTTSFTLPLNTKVCQRGSGPILTSTDEEETRYVLFAKVDMEVAKKFREWRQRLWSGEGRSGSSSRNPSVGESDENPREGVARSTSTGSPHSRSFAVGSTATVFRSQPLAPPIDGNSSSSSTSCFGHTLPWPKPIDLVLPLGSDCSAAQALKSSQLRVRHKVATCQSCNSSVAVAGDGGGESSTNCETCGAALCSSEDRPVQEGKEEPFEVVVESEYCWRQRSGPFDWIRSQPFSVLSLLETAGKEKKQHGTISESLLFNPRHQKKLAHQPHSNLYYDPWAVATSPSGSTTHPHSSSNTAEDGGDGDDDAEELFDCDVKFGFVSTSAVKTGDIQRRFVRLFERDLPTIESLVLVYVHRVVSNQTGLILDIPRRQHRRHSSSEVSDGTKPSSSKSDASSSRELGSRDEGAQPSSVDPDPWGSLLKLNLFLQQEFPNLKELHILAFNLCPYDFVYGNIVHQFVGFPDPKAPWHAAAHLVAQALPSDQGLFSFSPRVVYGDLGGGGDVDEAETTAQDPEG